jgi:regulatory protein
MSHEPLESALRELASKLLARREHSARELRNKLKEKVLRQKEKFPEGNLPHAIATVISNLTAKGYLDDRRFAVMLAKRARERRCYGDLRILRDLKRRGIDGKMAHSVLSELPDSAEALQRAVQIYISRRGQPFGIIEIQRLFRHLVRLGYAPSAVRQELGVFFERLKR